MTKNALFIAVAIVATLALGACAEMKERSKSSGTASGATTTVATTAEICTASPCAHTVTIDTSQSPCKVVVRPEIMVVKGFHDAVVTWSLDAPKGFVITALTFKDQDAEYLRKYPGRVMSSFEQFHGKKLSGTRAEVTDRNTRDGAWYYNVTVSDGKTECTIDPPVINGY